MICNVCNRLININGCGPSNDGWKTTLVRILPSSKNFEEACNKHDIAYHNKGLKKSRENAEKIRLEADNQFLNDMKSIVKNNISWYKRPFYYAHAYRNYYFVRKFGSEYFNYNGCI